MADRDVTQQFQSSTQILKWENGIIRLNNTANTLQRRTFRDASESTTPLGNGSYVDSTKYYAFFASAGMGQFDYTYSPISGAGSIATGTARSEQPFAQNGLYYGCQQSYPYSPAVPSALVSRCESYVLNRVKNNDFNLGVALGELPETIQFVGETLSSVGKLFRAIRHRDVGEARRVVRRYFGERTQSGPAKIPKNVATAYLQYQFAWKPMMNDIYNACKLVSDGLPESEAFKVKVALEDKDFQLPILRSQYLEEGKVTGLVKRGVEVGVSFKISNPLFYDLNRLGLVNPLSIAWELAPLSFVFDWFLPVGNFLESLTASVGIDFKTGYKTLWLRNTFDASYYPYGDNNNPNGTRAKVHFQTKSMYRYKLSSFPIPIPYLDVRLNIGKITSGLALIVAMRS
jgi:hypothetical protein